VNALIRFENFSSNGAVRYQWDFGDGSPPYNTNSMASFEHEYIRTGTYKACLIAFNSEGCSDTTCKDVQALIEPLMDVPNAFTPGRPGGSGVNHLIKVKGFGIEKINWRIYNRWGVKVFESTNKDNGWDGTYNGQPQPMDVYMYILEVQFTDNTTARRTGDITLIR
jgi:gliding motility-associated-like protein